MKFRTPLLKEKFINKKKRQLGHKGLNIDKILIQKGTKEVLEKFGPKNSKICLDFVSSVLDDIDN